MSSKIGAIKNRYLTDQSALPHQEWNSGLLGREAHLNGVDLLDAL